MTERTGVVTLKGNGVTLVGDEGFKVGAPAPNLKFSKSLMEDGSLADFKGKKLILSVVPSLDTPVCAKQTSQFNASVPSYGDDVVVLTISLDLPVAMTRWCGATGVEHVEMGSDYKHHDFATKSGFLIKEIGLLCRAIVLIDANGIVQYTEIVPEVAQEPNYDAVAAKLKTI